MTGIYGEETMAPENRQSKPVVSTESLHDSFIFLKIFLNVKLFCSLAATQGVGQGFSGYVHNNEDRKMYDCFGFCLNVKCFSKVFFDHKSFVE